MCCSVLYSQTSSTMNLFICSDDAVATVNNYACNYEKHQTVMVITIMMLIAFVTVNSNTNH